MAESPGKTVQYRGRKFKPPSVRNKTADGPNLPPIPGIEHVQSSHPFLQRHKPLPSIKAASPPKEWAKNSTDDLNSFTSSSNGSLLFQSPYASEESLRCVQPSTTPPKSSSPHSVSVHPVSCGSPEPEHPVTLCIKLPNCDRIEHRFDYKKDQIKDVIYLAHSSMAGEEAIPPGVDSVCLSDNSIPMNTFCDHSLSLYEAGLFHNTLLHFSYK